MELSVYVDSGNEQGDVFRVSREGWEVVVNPPVKFRRPRGMQALPTPVRGGIIDGLFRFLNLDPDKPEDWWLVISWLTMALRPPGSGAYPILALFGEQGSAKSTLSRVLRLLIDPNLAALRSAPREERDLIVAANNGHLLVFDNLSGLPGWLSDALCRLSTGGASGHANSLLTTKRYYFRCNALSWWTSSPGINAGASTSASPSPIEGSGDAKEDYWTLGH